MRQVYSRPSARRRHIVVLWPIHFSVQVVSNLERARHSLKHCALQISELVVASLVRARHACSEPPPSFGKQLTGTDPVEQTSVEFQIDRARASTDDVLALSSEVETYQRERIIRATNGPVGFGQVTARDLTAEVAFLTRALKAPTLRESVTRLAERDRSESWTHEEGTP